MLKIILTTLLVPLILGAPQSRTGSDDGVENSSVLTKFHVNADIKFRYSRTQVTAYYKNPGKEASKATFSMVIPQSAFISNFSMTIEDEEFVARVQEKEEAKKSYNEAVSSGIGAGIVEKDTRDSNIFNVDTNLEPGAKVLFTLTYEELLERKDSKYKYILNLNPGVVVKDFLVQININESLPLSFISAPEILESNELDASDKVEENRIAKIEKDVEGSPNNARIEFAPDEEYQLEAGAQGVTGRFEVHYDVDRQGQDNEVQVIDGYFVHYFVPSDLPTLPKHVVFVLDISGSMHGEKLRQLKDAMFTVLSDLSDSDYFNLVAFSDRISHWNQTFFNLRTGEDYEDTDDSDELEIVAKLPYFKASEENKNQAIQTVLELEADGSTNINDALVQAIGITKEAIIKEALGKGIKPMVVFLTDGLPSFGVTDHDEIKSNAREAIGDLEIPVFTIAFGEDTDVSLLQEIASENGGISKRIYEGSDAALQLEDFYSQISSPLLSKLKFDYVGGLVEQSSVSDSAVNTFFRGGEFIVTGKISKNRNGILGLNITGNGKDGLYQKDLGICLRSEDPRPDDDDSGSGEEDYSILRFPLDCHEPPVYPKSDAQSFLQKCFAFEHIKQMLKKRDLTQSEEKKSELTRNATRLALENNFVTDLTSLVVIKPDETPKVTEFVENVQEVLVSFKKSVNRIQSFGIQPLSLSFNLKSSNSYSYDSYDAAYDSYDYGTSNFESFSLREEEEEEVETDINLAECTNGTLSLYSKTYNRGEELELMESADDLRRENFTNKAVTALVSGDCCWELYADRDYSGEMIRLEPGKEYTSVTSLGGLFRNVESVKKLLSVC